MFANPSSDTTMFFGSIAYSPGYKTQAYVMVTSGFVLGFVVGEFAAHEHNSKPYEIVTLTSLPFRLLLAQRTPTMGALQRALRPT